MDLEANVDEEARASGRFERLGAGDEAKAQVAPEVEHREHVVLDRRAQVDERRKPVVLGVDAEPEPDEGAEPGAEVLEVVLPLEPGVERAADRLGLGIVVGAEHPTKRDLGAPLPVLDRAVGPPGGRRWRGRRVEAEEVAPVQARVEFDLVLSASG